MVIKIQIKIQIKIYTSFNKVNLSKMNYFIFSLKEKNELSLKLFTSFFFSEKKFSTQKQNSVYYK
jgi:hypothetical protein